MRRAVLGVACAAAVLALSVAAIDDANIVKAPPVARSSPPHQGVKANDDGHSSDPPVAAVVENLPGYGRQPLWKEPRVAADDVSAPSKADEDSTSSRRRQRRRGMGAKQTEPARWFDVYNHFGTCQVEDSSSSSTTTTSSANNANADCGICLEVGQLVPSWTGTNFACTEADVMTLDKFALATRLVEDAKNFLEMTLDIVDEPSFDAINFNSDTCGRSPGLTLSSMQRWLTSGESSCTRSIDGLWDPTTTVQRNHQVHTRRQMVIAVTYSPATRGADGDIAWASRCIADASTGRTQMIHLNINPAALTNTFRDTLGSCRGLNSFSDPDKHRGDLEAVIRVLTHAIGFRTDAFSRRGQLLADGTTFSRSNPFARSYRAALQKSVTVVASHRVREAARDFYGCASATGMEIEDYTNGIVSGTFHWEGRVGIDDLMTKEKMALRQFWSNMTTQFFVDTGFFTARPASEVVQMMESTPLTTVLPGGTEAAFRRHGRGQGCSFTSSKCNANGVSAAESAFCFTTAPDDNRTEFCTADRLARAYCGGVTRTSSVPISMRYSSLYGDTQGGLFVSPDYCPVKVPFADKSCVNSGNVDQFNVFGNVYGSTSRCHNSNVVISGFTAPTQGSRCFPTECSAATQIVTVFVLDVRLTCAYPADAGRTLDVGTLNSKLSGTYTCPLTYAEICGGQHAIPTGEMRAPYADPFIGDGLPAPALGGATDAYPAAAPVENAFTQRMACEHRLVECFAPQLDAAFAQGNCGAISRAFSDCFSNDCIDTRRELLSGGGQLSGLSRDGNTQRTIVSFASNCSDITRLRTTMCPTSVTADLFAYCNMNTRPSSAPPAMAVTTTMMVAIFAFAAMWAL